jgi:2-polyprenyl-3-methyl-5-hydroxy-6-metoxy-1,4-benzoquinol methylase
MFNKKYTEYWKDAVKNPTDGLAIPTDEILATYLKYMNIGKNVLDLGCSYGRMFNKLNDNFDSVCGIDVDVDTINEAKAYKYTSLTVSSAENTGCSRNLFDNIISWGVFDVVNQEKSLIECNRILKLSGKLMFTGKNTDYEENDLPAYVAERNAKLKFFPHLFTDLNCLYKNIEKFGFKINKAFIDERRGDLASNKTKFINFNLPIVGYNYILILEKISDVANSPEIIFTQEFSNTIMNKLDTADRTKIINYFKNDMRN